MFNRIKNLFRSLYGRIMAFIDRHPMVSFLALLLIFVLLIALSNYLKRPPEAVKETTVPTKSVEVYTIGSAPKVRYQAQVEKSGVIQITALAPGVVQAINFLPGDQVARGQVLISLASNYQGGNTFSLQRQLAQTQYNNVQDTYNSNKEIIAKQKEVAEKLEDNDEELRDISSKSIDETKGLISLNNEILSTLDQNLAQYQATNSATTDNSALILQTRQIKSQFVSANTQLQSALRNTEYTSSDEKIPDDLADLQKDITLKQLDIQEKALDLNKEVSRLQLQVAQVNEAMMFPAAPFSSSVERVYVKVGQAVQPGTPLLMLSQYAEEDPIVAIAYVTRDIAQKVSRLEPSTLYIANLSYEAYPAYVSRDAVQDSLHAVYFDIPDAYHSAVTEKGYIQIDIPVGGYDTSATVPFIPLDAVYQTRDQSYVYIVNKGYAKSKEVTLNEVFGRFIEVTAGLKTGDQIIVNRNVTDGDPVTVK